MSFKLFPSRFSLFKAFIGLFLLVSFIVRFSFLIWNFLEVDKSFFTLGNMFILGFLFDLVTISFLAFPYLIYLLFFPKRFYGSIIDKISTYFGFSIGVLIFFFSFPLLRQLPFALGLLCKK